MAIQASTYCIYNKEPNERIHFLGSIINLGRKGRNRMHRSMDGGVAEISKSLQAAVRDRPVVLTE